MAVPFAMTIQLFYKGAVKNDFNDPDVVSMSRSGNPAELLQGPMQFTIVMTYLGLKYFMKPEAIYMIAALGIGDGIAAIVGALVGSKFFTNYFGATKSAEGFAACVLGTYLGVMIFNSILGVMEFNETRVRIVSTIAGIVESQSPSNYDNFTIPLVLGIYLWYRQMLENPEIDPDFD